MGDWDVKEISITWYTEHFGDKLPLAHFSQKGREEVTGKANGRNKIKERKIKFAWGVNFGQLLKRPIL